MSAKTRYVDINAVENCFSIIRDTAALPDTLYHYTNGQAFIEIITGKTQRESKKTDGKEITVNTIGELWLSHFSGVNDSTEIEHGRTFIREEIERRRGLEVNSKFQPLYKELHDQLVLEPRVPHIYIACFTKDDNDLSQWRAYGGNAGYALGFCKSQLEGKSEALRYRLAPVVYKPSTKRQLIESVLNALEKSYQEFSLANSTNVSAGDIVSDWSNSIYSILSFMKHEAFEDENEYRISCSLDGTSDLYPESILRFRHRGTMLTRHLPFKYTGIGTIVDENLLNKIPLLVTTIRFGPTPHRNEAGHAVKQMLEAAGFNAWKSTHEPNGVKYISVKGSNTPYRSF